MSDILSPTVIQRLFQRRVKGGDVFKIPIDQNDAASDDDTIRGWHIVRVDDLHLRPITDTTASSSKNVMNRVRPKLKGSGVVPLSPSFRKLTNDKNDTSLEDKTIIYTVPNAKHYKIVTTGCQMNVADRSVEILYR